MTDLIKAVPLDRQFKEDYLGFGMYVIKERALPDVRDGLKPVQRRSLYTLYESGLFPNKPYQKSARVVGNVMGKYHPHGDSGIYDAIKTLARWWRTTIPLVDGKGNFGNIQGNDAAAMRYTEIRLSETGYLLTERLAKGGVKFVSNYDGSEQEPETLPITFPVLLINGSFGIAVGMTANCLPHNPTEVMKATIHYLKKPKTTLDELLAILPAPDFPSGGVILEADQLREYYETGEARFTICGKTEIDGNKVIITEVPWSLSGSSENLKNDIYSLIDRKVLKNARSVADYSNKDGIQIEVVAKSKDVVKQLEKELYAKTKLTSRLTGSLLVIHDGAPKLMGLLEYLDIYTDYQHQLLIRESKEEERAVSKRIEIVEGFLTAYGVMDVIIEVIKNSPNNQTIRSCLQNGKTEKIPFKRKASEKIASQFNFSGAQVDAILAMPLRRLSKLDQVALEKELKTLLKKQAELEGFIQSKTKRKNKIVKDHKAFLKAWGEIPRKTELSNQSVEEYEDKVSAEPLTIHIDRYGYIKAVPEGTAPTEDTRHLYQTTTTDAIGFWSSNGQFYKLKGDDITTKGFSIPGFVGLPVSDHLLIDPVGTPLLFSQVDGDHLFVTQEGLVKRVNQTEFPSVRKETVGTKLKEDDQLIIATDWLDKDFVVFVSEEGRVKRVESGEIKTYGKNSRGSTVSKPQPGDKVQFAYQVNADDTINLKGKEIKVSEIPLQKSHHTMKSL